jgi:hypothetical protein
VNRVFGFLLVVWATVGAAITAVVALFSGLLLVMNRTPWNAPGEPPLFELLLCGAGFLTAINLPLAVIARLRGQRSTYVFFYARLCLAVAAVMLIGSAAGILERHGRRWTAVRREMREYGDRIAAAAGDRNRPLTKEEFEQLRQRFLPQPVAVALPGHGTVRLRMAHAVYPYVGVDFGGGVNAFFEPRTMICTYSD